MMNFPKNSEIQKLLANTKKRLCEEYGWDEEFVVEAIRQYARFLKLHFAYPSATLVPGKVVDKVWHDHILHTRQYISFCQKHFGEYFHHDPKDRVTPGVVMDMKPTLAMYEERYGHPAPAKYWIDEVVVKLPGHASLSRGQPISGSVPSSKSSEFTSHAYTGGCCRCGS